MEEATAAVESLERQAKGLVAAVSVFKLDGSESEPAPAAATARTEADRAPADHMGTRALAAA